MTPSLKALIKAAPLVSAAWFLLSTANPAIAQEKIYELPDASSIGLPAGTKGPLFELPDQHHRKRSLASLMGPKGLVLVFFRSADW